MHWFGKFVLLPFNLIAAGAFVYLATQDWKGRQTIEAAGLRHLLLLNGLPLGDGKADPANKVEADPQALPADPEAVIPFRVSGPGGFHTTSVSKKLLEVYFQQAPGGQLGGPAVPNQLAQVRQTKAQIDALLSAADEPTRLRLLSGFLQYQPETFEQRVEVQRLVNAGNTESLEKLQKALNDRFAAVLDDPKPAAGDAETPAGPGAAPGVLDDKLAAVSASRALPLDAPDRARKLAHLLVNLSTDADWQKRVMMVVGLRGYVAAVDAQARRFKSMAARVRVETVGDQGEAYAHTDPKTGARAEYFTGFLGQLADLERLARQKTDEGDRQAKIRLAWEAQKVAADDFVNRRQTQLKAIEDQLRKTKAEVDQMLVRQGDIEAAMFAVQREVAITLDEVYKLQADLAARERELLGLPPLPKE